MSNYLTNKVSVVLASPRDWKDWLNVVKSAASKSDIWKYIDPAVADDILPVLTEPEYPSFRTVKPTATAISELNSDESLELSKLTKGYKRSIKKYDRQAKAMSELMLHIHSTVKRGYKVYFSKTNDPRIAIINLKKKVAPTDIQRMNNLIQQWKTVQLYKKGTEVEAWLQNWETLYYECSDENLAEV